MNNKKGKKRGGSTQLPALLVGVFFLAILVGVFVFVINKFLGDSSQPVDRAMMAEGIRYLEMMDEKSPSDVEKEIRANKKEELKKAMEAEEYNVWAYFGDIALMGDSRTKEFSHSEFLEERRVLAEDGYTLLNVPDYLEQLMDLNPAYVILQYGINDMEIPEIWSSAQVYCEDLDAKIAMIKEVVPDAVVFVQEILPAIDPELSRLECRREIPAWNEVIKAHCAEKGIPFIEVADLTVTYQEYYEPDGMHFTYQFYPYWAKRILWEVQSYEG